METTARRHEFDWLRVFAFAALVPFHAAIPFVDGGMPLVQNAEVSPVLEWATAFSHEFRLALLFLVSGAGSAFARRRRDALTFIAERARRLLPPLAVGILVLVPPMVWIERRSTGATDASLWAYLPEHFTNGVYPGGGISWHHLWFLAYLFVDSLLLLPLSGFLDRRSAGLRDWIAERPYRVFLPIVPLFALEFLLRHPFPGNRDLVHDWASFSVWLFVFVAGYELARSDRLLERVRTARKAALICALATTAGLFGWFWSPELGLSIPEDAPPRCGHVVADYTVRSLLRAANLWCWILAITGFVAVRFRHGGRTLRYWTLALYPIYVVHLPYSVAISAWVVEPDLGVWAKYGLVTVGTLAASWLTYHLLVRRMGPAAALLGGRGDLSAAPRKF